MQGNRTSYTYRTEGQVLTVQNPHGDRTSYSYDDAGRKVQQKRANGTWTSYTYDAASQNTQVSHYKSDNSLIDRFSWCPELPAWIPLSLRASSFRSSEIDEVPSPILVRIPHNNCEQSKALRMCVPKLEFGNKGQLA